MARPYLEEQALKRIAEMCPDITESIEEINRWAETELQIAQQCFDKPRQGRIAQLLIHVNDIQTAAAKIQYEAKS